MAVTAQRDEGSDGMRALVDGCSLVRLEVAGEPARGDAGVPARILDRDQGGQLQRLDE